MTSAIARWHSSARPPSDALEQAYADQLEAEMQEMAIQLHKASTERAEAKATQVLRIDQQNLKTVYSRSALSFRQRCEEVASLQSQVSQEKELRAVMEGCLMEDEMAWRRVHEDMSARLAEFRTCHTQLLSYFTAELKSASYAGAEGELRRLVLDNSSRTLWCNKKRLDFS